MDDDELLFALPQLVLDPPTTADTSKSSSSSNSSNGNNNDNGSGKSDGDNQSPTNANTSSSSSSKSILERRSSGTNLTNSHNKRNSCIEKYGIDQQVASDDDGDRQHSAIYYRYGTLHQVRVLLKHSNTLSEELSNEYEMCKMLHSPATVQAIELVTLESGCILVLEQPGPTLSELLFMSAQQPPLQLDQLHQHQHQHPVRHITDMMVFMRLAIAIVKAVGLLHDRGVVHAALTPDAITIDVDTAADRSACVAITASSMPTSATTTPRTTASTIANTSRPIVARLCKLIKAHFVKDLSTTTSIPYPGMSLSLSLSLSLSSSLSLSLSLSSLSSSS
jgi:hypothetical protein